MNRVRRDQIEIDGVFSFDLNLPVHDLAGS